MRTRSHGYATVVMIVIATATTTTMSSSDCPRRCECRPNVAGGWTVDCRGRTLTTVPVEQLPADVTELDVGGNPIGSITRSSFPSAMSRLRILRIDGCFLERLEYTTFRKLQMLEVLDLSRNRIESVDAGAFLGLQYLRILRLNDNNIREPPAYLFRGMNLEQLHLGGNELQDIPDDLFGAAKIQSLNLDDNRLFSLGRQFLRPLETHVRSLSVSNNLNPLAIAGDTFIGINLTDLSLANSRISDVEFLTGTTAVRVDLTGNRMKSFVLQAGGALGRACQELVLRDVGLESLDESVFVNLRRLKRLDLSGNSLTTFAPELFRIVADLTFLDLSRNRFARIPDDFGPQMYSLEALNLSRCSVSRVNWDGLREIAKLDSLDLSGNRLQVIPENASGVLDSIRVLNLSQNPWHCNCEMQWFRRWMVDKVPPQLGGGGGGGGGHHQLRCSSPEDSLMLDLSPKDFACTAPRITLITPSENVREGDNVMLSCAAQSDPAPAIVWRAPFGDVLSITPPEDRTRTKTTADWSIHRIKAYQSGWYSCNSTNIVQSNITYTYLNVVTSPADEEADLSDITFPKVPPKVSRQTTTTTTSQSNEEDLTTAAHPRIRETSSVVAVASNLRIIPETTAANLKTIVIAHGKDDDGVDDVDGPPSVPPLAASSRRASPAASRPSSTASNVVVAGAVSSARSAEAEAATTTTSRSPTVVVIIAAIFGVLVVVVVVVVVLIFVVYRRRRQRHYPVKEKERLASRDSYVGERAKLQMSILDDSGYSSRTTGDPLNPSKNRKQIPI